MQKFNFVEGLDKDVDVRYLKSTKYRDALNLRLSDSVGGNALSGTNIKGNTKVDYTLPDGKNTVIGSYEDVESTTIFWFIWNSRDDFQIVKYNYLTEEVAQVVEGIGLRFEEDKKVRDVVLIGNQYLKWTQEGKEAGSLDITVTYPTIIDSNRYLIEAAKQPHQSIITATYTSDPDYNDNKLRGSLWQFAVQYTYSDKSRSNISGRSIIATPDSDNIVAFGGVIKSTDSNQIDVEVSSGSEDVILIELFAREIQGVGVVGDWFVTDSVQKVEDTQDTVTFNFKNNKLERFANVTDTNQIGNVFPRKPKNQSYGYDKRMFYSNFTEGFEQVTVVGNLDWVYNDLPSGSPTMTVSIGGAANDTSKVKTSNVYPYTPEFVARTARCTNNQVSVGIQTDPDLTTNLRVRILTVNGTPRLGDKIIIEAEISNFRYVGQGDTFNPVTPFQNDYTKTIEYVVKQPDVDDIITLIGNLINAINSTDTRSGSGVGGFIALREGSIADNQLQIWYGIGSDVNSNNIIAQSDITSISATVEATSSTPPVYNFKRLVEHEFGVAYEDEKGRLSTVYTTENWKSSPLGNTNVNPSPLRGAVNAKLEINHIAPDDTVRYHIMHRVVKSRYIQFTGDLELVSGIEYSISLDDLTAFNTEYENSILGYEFVSGDKIRILRVSTGTIVQPVDGGIVDEVEISRFDTTENKIFFNFNQDLASPLVNTKYLFEIRGAAPESNNTIFFETGINYPVDGNGRHNSGTTLDDQNQTSTQPAIVNVNTYGDSYLRNRVFDADTSLEFFIEDDNVSDFYAGSAYGVGRSNFVDLNAEIRDFNTAIAFTEPFVNDSEINGTATVYDPSIQNYLDEWGSIEKMYSEGRRMMVFFTRKVGFIGINQANTISGAGGVSYDTSTVLTDMQFYDWETGIAEAGESFIEYGGNLYWADPFRGHFNKFAQNGRQALEKRGLSGEITELLKQTIGNPYKCIRPFYNSQYDEVGLCIGNDNIVTEDDLISKTDTSNEVLITVTDLTQFRQLSEGDTVTIYQKELGGGAPTYFETQAEVFSIGVSGGQRTVSFRYETERPEARPSFTWSIEQIFFENRTTYIYSEKLNAWVSRTSQEYEWSDFRNINFVTFKDGELWLEETNETRNNFYGTQFNLNLKVVVNENPSFPKRFKTIQQESTSLLTVPLIQTNTPSGANKSLLQESNLVANNFENRSNMFVAGFYKDVNTVNVNMPRYNGNDLRGQYAIIDLENTNTDEFVIFSVGVNYITTEVSNSD